MKRTSVVAALALAASGLLAPTVSAQAAPAAPAATIDWGPCTSATLSSRGAECGFLAVPLDAEKPAGTKIEIAVSRIKHKVPDAEYQGVMLVNPGGPGGSGLVYSIFGEFVPGGAGDAYDWIGFDPRGVGASVPSLSCDTSYFEGPRPAYVPVNPNTEKPWLKKTAGYAADCGEAGGALLDHVRTTDSVADMDAIRAALGEKQINFYGFSYGTYLAQVYATKYPSHVRRMVLDSNVDPRKVFYRSNLDQNVAFEDGFGAFFKWIAKYDAVYHLGRSQAAVEARFYREQAGLKKKLAEGVVGEAEWNDMFVSAGYNQSTWPGLADLFVSWAVDRDPADIVAEYEGTLGDDNGYAMYLATQCTDAPWPKSFSTLRLDTWKTFLRGPYLSWNNAWYNAPCLTWPAKSAKPVDVDGSKAPPVLLIGETLDGATPFSGSLEVRKRFPRSSLISLPGGTNHANSLSGDECLDDQVAAYLADGTLPQRKPGTGADASCAPLPSPVPDEAAATTATGGATRAALRAAVAPR